MSTTWGNIKDEFHDAFRDVSGSFIGDTELLRMLRRVLRLINTPLPYTFQQSEYTLTLTGTTQYDLDTLLGRWKEILSITKPTTDSLAVPYELEFIDLMDFAVSIDRYAYTIFGHRYLRVYSPTGSPLSGTLKVYYYSDDLVRDATTNAFKQIPTVDADYFAIPERYTDVVSEGLMMLGFRKDRSNKDDYRDAKKAFDDRLAELVSLETIEVHTPKRNMKGAF